MIKTQLSSSIPIFTIILILLSLSPISESRDRHVVTFRSRATYPESLTYDPTSQRFIVAAIRRGTFHSISAEGVTEHLTLTDSAIKFPPNPTILGLAVDRRRSRLIAAVNTAEKPYLAAFTLNRNNSLSLIFLSPLPTTTPTTAVANDVTLDPYGNAYVTNSGENFIWKVSLNGTASILSTSSIFAESEPIKTSPYSNSGLNGIIYISSEEYLLVVQSTTGKLFKVNAIDGTATSVNLPLELTLGDGIAVRKDGAVFIISVNDVWMLKSDDSWTRGELIDKIALEKEGFNTGICVGEEGRVYVVYGYIDEGKKVNSDGEEIEWFRIEEVWSKKDSDVESLWPFLMIGLGLLYFLFWRFQMARLANNMGKKHPT